MATVKVRIEGSVRDELDKPVSGAVISLLKARRTEIGKRVSRADGEFVFAKVELEEGEYAIHCDPPEDYRPPADHSIRVESGIGKIADVNFICAPATQILQPAAQISGGVASMANNVDLTKIESLLRDIATFTPTKDETTGGVVGGAGADGAIAARKVSKVIAQVLRRPIGGDPMTFLAALTAAFPEGKDGQIVRMPVQAVVSLDVERGLLAASQGTLFHQVQLIVNDALKVLDGLRSISPETDKEEAAALMEIVRQEFSSLIGEAGSVDRPRNSRVDEIFGQLLSTGRDGHLTRLRKELGLNATDELGNDDHIVTSEEAQLVASMDLLDQYASTLKASFDNFFTTGAGKDPRNSSFSGKLAFVSILFSVVAASVREVEADMDAVDFSEAERRTSFIIDPTVRRTSIPFRISIDSILSWVEIFALEEGPDLIAKSGRIGLDRVLEVVRCRLEPLVFELLQISKEIFTPDNPPPAPHPGLTHSRVKNALEQLDVQLRQFNTFRPPAFVGSIGFNQGKGHGEFTFNATAFPGELGGSITSFVWDFGDGTVPIKTQPTLIPNTNNASTETPTHTYQNGSFVVTLKVTDSNCLTAFASTKVTVS